MTMRILALADWLLHGHTYLDPNRHTERLGSTRIVHVRGAVPLELTEAGSEPA
jgi:hypothetical protein